MIDVSILYVISIGRSVYVNFRLSEHARAECRPANAGPQDAAIKLRCETATIAQLP